MSDPRDAAAEAIARIERQQAQFEAMQHRRKLREQSRAIKAQEADILKQAKLQQLALQEERHQEVIRRQEEAAAAAKAAREAAATSAAAKEAEQSSKIREKMALLKAKKEKQKQLKAKKLKAQTEEPKEDAKKPAVRRVSVSTKPAVKRMSAAGKEAEAKAATFQRRTKEVEVMADKAAERMKTTNQVDTIPNGKGGPKSIADSSDDDSSSSGSSSSSSGSSSSSSSRSSSASMPSNGNKKHPAIKKNGFKKAAREEEELHQELNLSDLLIKFDDEENAGYFADSFSEFNESGSSSTDNWRSSSNRDWRL